MNIKLEITGTLEVLTGMHIGGSSAFAAIGAVDSPVVRDTLSDRPMIPGSSLKGKLRTLLARQYNQNPLTAVDNDDPRILRLFGCSKKEQRRSRLLFRDMILPDSSVQELQKVGLYAATEVKFENSINRLSAVANPRQIERVIRGCKFDLNILYDLCETDKLNEITEDIALLAEGMRLLEYDYLGGHGSRGYGKVKFSDLQLRPAVGKPEEAILADCQASLDKLNEA